MSSSITSVTSVNAVCVSAKVKFPPLALTHFPLFYTSRLRGLHRGLVGVFICALQQNGQRESGGLRAIAALCCNAV